MTSSANALPGFAELAQHAACGILLTATDGAILRANATFCGWLGTTEPELAGRRFHELLTMGGRIFHQTHWGPLLQMQGSVAEVKLDLVHRDGHSVPVLINAIRRLHGAVVYDELAVIVVRDRHKYERELIRTRENAEAALAAQREAQRSLHESRDVLGLAMRGGRMGVWSRDLVSEVVWWSRELEHLVGFAEGTFGGSEAAFFEIVHEEDRPAISRAVQQAIAQHTDYIVEFRFRHASGEWRWMEGRGRAAYDAAGRAQTLYGLGIDITERKEAERIVLRQAAIFEHQNDAIIITDLGGAIVDFNPACERMLGYSAPEVLGHPLWRLCKAHGRRRVVHAARAGVGLSGEWRGEVEFVRKDGSGGICESVIKLLANAAGHVYGAVSVNRDISERRRNEAQLRRLNEQLSVADRRKDEFLATLAHELRNPLAPMQSVLAALRMKNLDDPQLRWGREIFERQLQHMTHLVDDLLEVSRITQGKLELRRERLELASAVSSAVEAARPLVQASAHELTVKLPREPVLLDADPTRLAQIILNLLNNAAKYTPPGGRIWLSAERVNGEAVVSVRDSGIGIAREHLARVFEMFSQLSPALERAQGGLGIGLSLVRGLVELHGGSVAACSAGPGQGSEFTVRLPVSAGTQLPRAREAAETSSAASRRVLVVDDNRDAADSMAMVLELCGHDVNTAYDGASGLERARELRPDVLILDIGLPQINGYEIARQVRGETWGHGALLIAVTGWGQEQDKLTARDAGFDHHFTKPVDPARLNALLTLKGAAPG